MEYLDTYDKDGNYLGKKDRNYVHEHGLWHNTIHCWLYDREGNAFFQIRHEEKTLYTSASGHVLAGESIKEAFGREIKEELGLNINTNELEFISLVKHPTGPCLINLYLLEKDIYIEKLKLQEEEVESVSWLTEEEILSLIKENRFLKSHGYLFENYIIKN